MGSPVAAPCWAEDDPSKARHKIADPAILNLIGALDGTLTLEGRRETPGRPVPGACASHRVELLIWAWDISNPRSPGTVVATRKCRINCNETVSPPYRLSNGGKSGCLLYTSPSPRDRQKSRMP